MTTSAPASAASPDLRSAAPPPSSAAVQQAAFRRTALLLVGYYAFYILSLSFCGEKLSFLYKDKLDLSPSAFALFGIVASLGLYLRPVFGSLSDFVPIFGWHRRSDYCIAVLLQSAALLTLALARGYSYLPVLCAVIVRVCGIATAFVVIEAVYVRIGKESGQFQMLQSIQALMFSVLLAAFGGQLSGYVTQHWSYRACFLAASACAAFLPACSRWSC